VEARTCSVSVDLDSIACYYRIHGLGESPDELRHLILRRCLPRFVELFAEHSIEVTLFVVAEDIDADRHGAAAKASRALLEECVVAGHEIGNHSYAHPYDLARWEEAATAAELGRAHELLSSLGRPVVGFRAPGYDLSVAMLRTLDGMDYLYDSSVFPAPGYYAAKLAVLGAMRALGKKSGAVVTNPFALAAPTRPYRPSLRAPWRRGQSRLVELPIAVTPGLRLPAIGTSLLMAPPAVREHLLAGASRGDFFNLELHGIDLADAELDGIPGELVARQPDLRLSLADKRERLASILATLAASFEFAPLVDVASAVQARV